MPQPTALCFGEVLWDFLPEGLFPGGAPFNVSVHLNRLGVKVGMATAVGRDALGDELLRRMRLLGLPTQTVSRHADLPTGTVKAAIGRSGDARYVIARRCAWDRIPASAACLGAARRARALVFGSLALRSPCNRATLSRLLAAAPADALRVFDVNLRPPHDNLNRVRALARRATLLKLNAAEAAHVAARGLAAPGKEEANARLLAAQTGAQMICVTSGPRGAGLFQSGRWHWEPGRVVKVADTVGAGDAFLASMVADLLHARLSAPAILARACRTGEWVATQRGATPTPLG
jgi:fructokinase